MPTVQTISGGLMAAALSIAEGCRHAGTFTAQVLNGAKPADMPQPTKVELVINLKVAKVFGLAIPSTLLARADEMIE